MLIQHTISSYECDLHHPPQAVLPKEAKVSEDVYRAAKEAAKQQQQRGGAGNQKALLDDLVHFETVDGRSQVVLSVDRPAFTTVMNAYCSDCTEKEEALKAAEAWAHDIRDGLAAELSLASGGCKVCQSGQLNAGGMHYRKQGR